MRDDEGEIDADEDDERELKEPLQRVDRVGVHRRATLTETDSPKKAAEASAKPASAAGCHYFVGLSLTIMARELPQFGTGSV